MAHGDLLTPDENGLMQITRELLDAIAADHGPAFYLLDAQRFEENFSALVGAFRRHCPNTSIAYSYKTNYIPRFCRIVDRLGGYAEVVSIMEAELAARAGVDPRKVFFNGPFKEIGHIAAVLSGGGVVNADSLDELRLILQFAEANPDGEYRIGLRLNFDVGDGVLSRFGIDAWSEDFPAAREAIAAAPNLRMAGLHCHFATRTLACWSARTKGMLAVLDSCLDTLPAPLEFVSLGGGLYGSMPDEMKAQFPVPIPSFADYAEVAAKPFAEFFARRTVGKPPLLIIEPGTALVADAMKFAARVVSVKQVQGKAIATLAGSTYNVNPTPNRKNVPIEVVPDPAATEPRRLFEDADFAGYTCIESDYLYRGYTGEIARGDFVMFDDVGSYSVVMKPPFILPNVAIVECDAQTGRVDVIKRRETVDDLFATYRF